MKAMFAVLLLGYGAVGAHELKCPASYPSNPISLPERPPGQAGVGEVRGGSLSDAYIYAGELHGRAYGFDAVTGPEPIRVKNGWNTEYTFTPSETKWLVCAYGGNELSRAKPRVQGKIEWWEPIAPRVTRCVLQVRELKQPYKVPSNWVASAVCDDGK